MIGCLPTQALAFLAVFVYATHATQAIAFEWKPSFKDEFQWMSVAPVSDRKGIRLQKLCTNSAPHGMHFPFTLPSSPSLLLSDRNMIGRN